MQRLLPPTLVLLLGLAATVLHFALGLTSIPRLLRVLGLPIASIGLGMSAWGSKRFEEVGTNIKTFDRPDQLVSDGLFGWSRNPMYLGFLILLAGAALGLGSWAGVTAPVVFFVAADRWYIPFEEAQMKRTFSDEYETYAQQVRRWLGRRQA